MKPILFNTNMVRAILDGRKTVTRRAVKYTTHDIYKLACANGLWYQTYDPNNPPKLLLEWYVKNISKPIYKPGDILYVRETWDNEPVTPGGHFRPGGVWYYKADGDLRPEAWCGNWRPSIHMPKDAARIFLRVTNVRVERLQDITDDDISAEGLEIGCYFDELWNGTIKPADRDKYGWAANPWVWVIDFERISKEEALQNE